MFGRRIFGSAPIPRSMYGVLRISTVAQARRMLPMLVPIVPSMHTGSGSGQMGQIMRASDTESLIGDQVLDMDASLMRMMLESVCLQAGYLRLLELWGVSRFPVIGMPLPVTARC